MVNSAEPLLLYFSAVKINNEIAALRPVMKQWRLAKTFGGVYETGDIKMFSLNFKDTTNFVGSIFLLLLARAQYLLRQLLPRIRAHLL